VQGTGGSLRYNMPRYDFKCDKCQTEWEEWLKITDDSVVKCKCGAEGEKIISGIGGVRFRGAGFYTNDYKNKVEK
jgi:putative FmdB family regulatory protein